MPYENVHGGEVTALTPSSEAVSAKLAQLRLERKTDEAVRLLKMRLAGFEFGSEVEQALCAYSVATFSGTKSRAIDLLAHLLRGPYSSWLYGKSVRRCCGSIAFGTLCAAILLPETLPMTSRI